MLPYMNYHILFVNFYCIGYNCYQLFICVWAFLFHIWGDLSLINNPLGDFQIFLVSITLQRYHHHISHKNMWWVAYENMLFPFHFRLVPAQDVHFFYTRSHLSALQNCELLFSINFQFIFILEKWTTQFSHWIVSCTIKKKILYRYLLHSRTVV